MAAIRAHCHRVLLINEGRLVADGDTDEVIARYEELQRTLAGAATGKAPAD
jgi:ABC-type polysaccharide/polyol phosphate transport system ATPase subunit